MLLILLIKIVVNGVFVGGIFSSGTSGRSNAQLHRRSVKTRGGRGSKSLRTLRSQTLVFSESRFAKTARELPIYSGYASRSWIRSTLSS